MRFDLQGHRGARGLRPENTLPSFEAALDAGVTTIETDLHLTADGVPVLCHDPWVSGALFDPAPARQLAVHRLTLADLRPWRAARNPSPTRFPTQRPDLPALAVDFAAERGFDPYAVPTLADLFAFVRAYAGDAGARCGKSPAQRASAAAVRFDLELKRVPFHPEAIGDAFDGRSPGLLERRVLEEVRGAGVIARTNVRSFDHRSVRVLKELEPGLTAAVLIASTAPFDPGRLAREAGAALYCPSFDFVDADVVARVQAAGVRIVPWTVNEPEQWERLLEWGVDGMTTDYPDRLAEWLRARGVEF